MKYSSRPQVLQALKDGEISVVDAINLIDQIKFMQGRWVPACDGTEQPFKTRSGIRVLYCWHTGTGQHAYINCDTDLILSDEEIAQHMQ